MTRPSPLSERIGYWMRAERLAMHVSLEDAAARLGWSVERLLEFERSGNISLFCLKQFVTAFGICPDQMLHMLLQAYLELEMQSSDGDR